MKKSLGCLLSVIFSSLVGIWISIQLFNLWAEGAFVPWQSTNLPAGISPAKFVIYDGPYVYLQTADGELYAQQLETSTSPTWEVAQRSSLVTDPAYSTKYLEKDFEQLGWWTRKPPGEVRQLIECDYFQHKSGVTYRYALLENDKIWRSSFGIHPTGGLVVSLKFMGGDLLGGVVLGLLLFGVIIWLKRAGVRGRDGG
jgi:hypothetical protein